MFYQDPEFLREIIDITRDANAVLRNERSPSMQIDEKVDSNGRKSKVTSGDIKANDLIMKRLNEVNCRLANESIGFYNIISEEIAEASYDERHKPLIDGSWLVDPLDGTADYCNFDLDSPSYTCNIGLIIGDDPVFGIVSVPETGVIYYGIKDIGSFKIENETEIEDVDFPGTKLVIDPDKDISKSGVRVATSASHMNHATKYFIDSRLNDVTCKAFASSLKLAAVAEGSVDIYPRCGLTCEWDTCAADAVVRFAGGGVYIYHNDLPLSEHKEMLKYNKLSLYNPFFVVF